jgi:hypothetical protein
MDLKEVIQKKGWTQSYVAIRLGVGPDKVCNWCKGFPVPEKYQLPLGRLLGISKKQFEKKEQK